MVLPQSQEEGGGAVGAVKQPSVGTGLLLWRKPPLLLVLFCENLDTLCAAA